MHLKFENIVTSINNRHAQHYAKLHEATVKIVSFMTNYSMRVAMVETRRSKLKAATSTNNKECKVKKVAMGKDARNNVFH